MSKPTFRERLRYRSDQFFQSGFTLQLVISAIVLTSVITMFYVISVLLGVHPGADFDIAPGASDPFWPSTRFWWVLTHVLESYWIERTTLPQVLSLLMTLFNLLVLAALVGLFGSRIQQKLEQMRRGTSRVVEHGHIVILGWSGKVLPIMRELGEGLEDDGTVFVLHTMHTLEEIDGKLKREFSRRNRHFKRRHFRWVIRQGSMTDMKDLDNLNIQDARTVIILSQDGDAQVIKSIMAVSQLVRSGGGLRTPPLLIAEICQRSMLRLARAAAHELEISIVQPAEYLSRIILQTARQQGLVNVYDELLSHSRNELHFTMPGAFAGRLWNDIQFSFPKAIPIGIMRGGIPMLAPRGPVHLMVLDETDVVICLAKDEEDMRTSDDELLPPLPPPPGDTSRQDARLVRNLLILGWNEKTQPLLQEYANYATTLGAQFRATLVSASIPDWISATDPDINREGVLGVELLREDGLAEGVLERVRPQGFDAVVVLGEQQRRETAEDADTKVIMLLLLLRTMRTQVEHGLHPFPEQQQIVTEILDSANKELAESTGAVQDVIISNDLVSNMIAQICRDKRTEPVLTDLFDEYGKEIYMKPAVWYAAEGSDISFGQLQRAAFGKGEIAIGVGQFKDDAMAVELNPGRAKQLLIHAGLFVVLISEHEGKETGLSE